MGLAGAVRPEIDVNVRSAITELPGHFSPLKSNIFKSEDKLKIEKVK